MANFGDRLRHAQGGGEEKLRGEEARSLPSGGPPREGSLEQEEAEALGDGLRESLEAIREDGPPRLGLDEWRSLLQRVEAELRREDLAPAEKRALRRDIRAMRPRRLSRRIKLAMAAFAAAGVAGGLYWTWLLLFVP